MASTVNYSQQGAVAIIAMNRPDSLNGFTSELCEDLVQAFEKARDESSVRAIVLTGEGRAFSAGADLKAVLDDRPVDEKLRHEFRPVMVAIAEVPKPVVAAVSGFAAGIGLSYAMYSDLLIMADDAFLLSPFTAISLLPDGGANWLMVRQLGYRRAFQLCVESERIGADRCLELGIANKVVPAAGLRTAAVAWAQSLSELAPLSLAATKKAMRHAMDNSWADCFEIEATLQGELSKSEDAAEGIEAFLQKRTPNFQGR